MEEDVPNKYKEVLSHLSADDIVSQGAEAVMYKVKVDNEMVMVKHRFPKSYREPTLDKSMNKKRVNNESRMLERFAEMGIACPKLLYCAGLDIVMEYIEGKTLKAFVNDCYREGEYPASAYVVMRRLGNVIGEIHKKGFIHGDLTTSNFMIGKDDDIFIIDFGLSTRSVTTEDRAVDLYVLERALLCTHYKADDLVCTACVGSYSHTVQTRS